MGREGPPGLQEGAQLSLGCHNVPGGGEGAAAQGTPLRARGAASPRGAGPAEGNTANTTTPRVSTKF